MKKLIFVIIMAGVALANAKTMNLLEWEPKFKYTSNEIYTYKDAKQIKEKDRRINIRCEDGKCRLYKTPLNCPEFRTSNMDEYLLDAFRARQLIDICFGDSGKVEYHFVKDKTGMIFNRGGKKYIFEDVFKYTGGKDEFGKVYKIRRLSDSDHVTWKTNDF